MSMMETTGLSAWSRALCVHLQLHYNARFALNSRWSDSWFIDWAVGGVSVFVCLCMLACPSVCMPKWLTDCLCVCLSVCVCLLSVCACVSVYEFTKFHHCSLCCDRFVTNKNDNNNNNEQQWNGRAHCWSIGWLLILQNRPVSSTFLIDSFYSTFGQVMKDELERQRLARDALYSVAQCNTIQSLI